MSNAVVLPQQLAEIIADFTAMAVPDRLQLLVEFGQELPDLPEKYAQHPELLEPVVECQSPVYLLADVVDSGGEQVVRLHFSAPPQAPTTRGFAGVLHAALDGLPVASVLALPADISGRLGLDGAVSPLRLGGMAAMLGRIKRQVREKSGTAQQKPDTVSQARGSGGSPSRRTSASISPYGRSGA